MLTEEERRQELIDLWTAQRGVRGGRGNFDSKNNLAIIVQSGARGNMQINRSQAGGLVREGRDHSSTGEVQHRDGLSKGTSSPSTVRVRSGRYRTGTAESGYFVVWWTPPGCDRKKRTLRHPRGPPMKVGERDENRQPVLVKAVDGGPYRLLAR